MDNSPPNQTAATRTQREEADTHGHSRAARAVAALVAQEKRENLTHLGPFHKAIRARTSHGTAGCAGSRTANAAQAPASPTDAATLPTDAAPLFSNRSPR